LVTSFSNDLPGEKLFVDLTAKCFIQYQNIPPLYTGVIGIPSSYLKALDIDQVYGNAISGMRSKSKRDGYIA
jgi:hypothetical protein